MIETLLDLIYPRQCRCCCKSLENSQNRFLCFSCWRKLPLVRCGICNRCGSALGVNINANECPNCFTKKYPFSQVRIGAHYQGHLRQLLLSFKFAKEYDLHYPLAAIMLRQICKNPFSKNIDFVVSVPLGKKTLLTRGYNQSSLLAQYIARDLELPYLPKKLIKIKTTPPQSQLTMAKRKQNLQGAFVCNSKYTLKGKRVLLIDDILTTGATASECTKTLKQDGARQVYVVVLARPGDSF